MKKKLLALSLGGVLAVGVLATPSVAEAMTSAECNYKSEAHITASEVAVVDGYLTVTIDIGGFQASDAYFNLIALEKTVSDEDFYGWAYEWEAEGSPAEAILRDCKGSGTYTFKGLTPGKAYYVYCIVIDLHGLKPSEDSGEHQAAYLAGGTPTAGAASVETPAETPSETPSDTPTETPAAPAADESRPSVSAPGCSTSTDFTKAAEKAMIDRIQTAEAGSTVVLDEGVTTLPNSVMKELRNRSDVSLKLAYTYDGQDYVVVIPAGAAVDNDIPWYGPLYLAQQYGNFAGTDGAASANGGVYEVKAGDRLGRIAAANHMTLKQLLGKNPQIKDANKIKVGQKINL